MQGYRKIILGVFFLTYSTFLSWTAMKYGTDLLALAGIITSMSMGLGVVIWGNVASHKASGGGGNDAN
jgi:hypothetical protein